MRILHVVPSYLPALRYGGPIVSVHGLCKALARRGHDVHVFTTNVDGDGESAVAINVPVNLDGVKVWYFPVPMLRRLYWSPRMMAALREQVPAFDVLHTHSVFLWPTWAAARMARRHHVPYVLAPRGMLVQALIQRKSSWLKRAWIRLIEQTNISKAAAIHVTSDLETADLREFGFRLPAIEVIPNGVEIQAPDEPSLAQAEPGESAEEPYLLFIGRVNWKKGLDRLIPALALLPDMRLLIAGNDEENYRPTLEDLAKQSGAAHQVRFLGPVYGAGKTSLLRGALALVLPSYSENFGNVVLEAMAAGCPVVLTPEVGAAELVRSSGAGMVVSGNAAALAAAIAQIAADAPRRAEMGLRGVAAVRDRYTWDAVGHTMEDAYARAVVLANSPDNKE